MLSRLLAVFLCLTIASNVSHADIKRIDDIQRLKTHLKTLSSNDLVIFDIDDVVIQPVDKIFHPYNKLKLVEYYESIKNKVTQQEMVDILSSVNMAQKFQLVDDHILEIFAILKERKINTIALTHCGTGDFGKIPDVAEWRLIKLRELGINFQDLNKFPDQIYSNLQERHGVALFRSGILFTAFVDKGVVLNEFLASNKIKPVVVIFIDDKKVNLESVENALTQYNITFTGYEYIAKYNPYTKIVDFKITDFQFATLLNDQRWIPDTEAYAYISTDKP